MLNKLLTDGLSHVGSEGRLTVREWVWPTLRIHSLTVAARFRPFSFTHSAPATRTEGRSPAPPQRQVLRQGLRVGLVGDHGHEVDAVPAASFGEVGPVAVEVGEVRGAQVRGVDGVEAGVFHGVEAGPGAEGEVELVAVVDLEDDHLVAGVAEVGEASHQGGDVVEAVADEDDEPAAVELGREVVEDVAQ